jgi:molecular chaperone GrpE
MSDSDERATLGSATAAEAEHGRTADDLLESLQRERADFLNYKRRVERERAQDREAAQAEVIRALLPLLDELDRGLAQAPADLASHPWARGIGLIRHQIATVMHDLDVERIGVEGEPFDPARHEALFFDTQPGVADQRVSRVVKPGYRLGDRLLRAAQVGVVGPAAPAVAPIAAGASVPPTQPTTGRATGGGRSGV